VATFPAPAEGIVLTHFVVASDVGRSRRFYAGVLGGEVLKDGEPTIIARRPADPPAGTGCLKPSATARTAARWGARDSGHPSLPVTIRPGYWTAWYSARLPWAHAG
jgi:hypothetical protein